MVEEKPKDDVVQTPTLLEETRAAVEELKKANAERKALIEREERNEANKLLAGRTEAGKPADPPKVETPKEYSKRIIAGNLTDAEKAKRFGN